MTDKTKPRLTVGAVVHVDPSKATLTAALATILAEKFGGQAKAHASTTNASRDSSTEWK